MTAVMEVRPSVTLPDDVRARNAATIERLRAEDRTRRLIERVLHTCPDGHTSYLCSADTCERCGWSPLTPVPDIETMGHALVSMYGPDAVWFVMALAHVVEEVSHGCRR